MGRLDGIALIILGLVLLVAAGFNDARVSGGGILGIIYGFKRFKS